MYTQRDIADIKAQTKRQILIWLLPEALLLGLVVFSFIHRVQWLTAALFALLGCAVLFSLSLFILPLIRYRKFLEQAVLGKQRRSILAFKSAGDKAVMRDGVAFIPLMLTAGQPREAMDDRQLYWDQNLPLPAWQTGDRLTIDSHEKAVTRWETADPSLPLDG